MTRRKAQSSDDSGNESEGTAPAGVAVADTSAADAAAESAGIVGAGATASGFASANQGERTVVQEAESDNLSGPMSRLDDGGAEAFQEQGANKEFTADEQGRTQGAVVSKVPLNPSADYPGRDKALAATDGGRLMPGNLDAILRARSAGTQVPGDAQLMSAEEIDALKAEFVDGVEPRSGEQGEGTAFVKGDNPNAFIHENEINPNTPTNERVER